MQDFELEDDDVLTVNLPLEDGTEIECEIVLIYEIEGQDYAALYPSSGEPDELYFFRCSYDGSDNIEFEEIADEEEFKEVTEAFDSIMEEEEWNELMGYDD